MRFIQWALCLVRMSSALYGTHDSCEQKDGSCPPCADYPGDLNFNAVAWISPDRAIGQKAMEAQLRILRAGPVKSLDPPFTFLHMTLFYFCCQTPQGVDAIFEAMRALHWDALPVSLDSFGCNVKKDGSCVYLHAMPSEQGKLFALSRKIEEAVESQGGRINHPRKSMFHTTLARAAWNFPTQRIVEVLGHERLRIFRS